MNNIYSISISNSFNFLLRVIIKRIFVIGFLLSLIVGQTFGQPSNTPSGQNFDSEESGDEIAARELFFHLRRAGGEGKAIPAGAYEFGSQQLSQMKRDRNSKSESAVLSAWTSVNPTGMFYGRTNANYISGRANCIAFNPTDPNTFYIAAAGGGVWKTVDGAHFQAITDNVSALTSGAVAVDPNNGNVVYVATGEMNYSLDSYFGDGIFKSSDGGNSWTKIATTAVGSYFSSIVINPQNSNILYVAGSNGVYRSTDAGTTWQSMNTGGYANALVMNPINPYVLYTATGAYGQNTISKTTDGGLTWNSLSNGLPSSGGSRTALAISSSNPSILYASVANSNGYGLLGLYRTTDAGSTWTLQNSSTNYLGSQGWYDNAVTVNPTNSNYVVVGGLDIYASTDGGVTLIQKTVWYSTSANNFSHADIHFLGYNGSVLYCGSDGGVYKSSDNGNSWADLNQTLSTLQFQSADYDPSNTQRVYGGTQDNDKEYTTNGGTLWVQPTTGDGGYTVVDPVNTNYIYGQYVNGSLHRSSDHGMSYNEISPSGSTGGLFYNPYEMAPGDHNTIIFGRSDVWKTTSAQSATTSSGWSQIASSSTVGGNVSAIGISSSTTNTIYIGTDNGKILVTTNNGLSWSTTSGYPYVTDFAVDNTNDSICYATFGGFSSSQHIYKTTNKGASWFNVTGNLPNIPVISTVLRTTSVRTLFVGTDLGVYESTNEGTTWFSFNDGIPAVEVYDLKYKESTHILLAATHGRGCYSTNLNQLGTVNVTVETNNYGAHLWIDGTDYGPYPYTTTWLAGTQHSICADSIYSPVIGPTLILSNWNNGVTTSCQVVAPTHDTTFTANYKPYYYLSISDSGNFFHCTNFPRVDITQLTHVCQLVQAVLYWWFAMAILMGG